MLPTSSSAKGSSGPHARSNSFLPQYLRRIVKWRQMDIEYTFWQMLHLCTSPKSYISTPNITSVLPKWMLLGVNAWIVCVSACVLAIIWFQNKEPMGT